MEEVSDRPFDPDWVSPPGDTILDLLKVTNTSRPMLASLLNVTVNVVEGLLNGDVPICYGVAVGLARKFGSSPEFWMERDCQYRLARERLLVG